ncbi:hypothetical protein AgCh_033915 [Apium graveolens]
MFKRKIRKALFHEKDAPSVDYKKKYFHLLKKNEKAFLTQENDWAADAVDEDEETSYVNLALMAKSDEAEVNSSRNRIECKIAKDELTESLKKKKILRKQLERQQEVIKAWKSSRNVHAQIAKVQGTESFCEEAWKKNKEKLDPELEVRENKRVNAGHLSIKQLNDRLEEIEFTWTYFLKSKDEASEIIINHLRQVNSHPDLKLRRIRSDNGTVFKNSAMRLFCEENGIMHEFSAAKTQQPNGVVERKNISLIEAARTMLEESKSFQASSMADKNSEGAAKISSASKRDYDKLNARYNVRPPLRLVPVCGGDRTCHWKPDTLFIYTDALDAGLREGFPLSIAVFRKVFQCYNSSFGGRMATRAHSSDLPSESWTLLEEFSLIHVGLSSISQQAAKEINEDNVPPIEKTARMKKAHLVGLDTRGKATEPSFL